MWHVKSFFEEKMQNFQTLKNIFLLSFGTIIAQLIPISLQPILKRIFSAEEFGVLDIYLKILGFLIIIYTLKYEIAVILPKNRIKSLILLNLSILLAFFFTGLVLLLILIFDDKILLWLKLSSSHKIILYLLPVSTLFFSITNSFNYFLIRQKRFGAASYNKISRRASEGMFQLFFLFINNIKSYGLIISDLIGNIVSAFFGFFQNFRRSKFDKRFFNFRLIFHVAKEYQEVAKYNIFPELVNNLFSASLSFLILSRFTLQEVGFMELTQRILIIPSALLSVSVGQVLLQKTTEQIANQKSIKKDFVDILKYLLLAAIPFVLIIYFFAEPLFSLFFGEEWLISGTYSKYLIIFFAVGFVFSPLGQILIALKKFKVNALWQITKLLVIFSLYFFSFGEIKTYLIFYNILGSIIYFLYGGIIYYNIQKYENNLLLLVN